MTPEEAKAIRCDRCGAVVGLHQHRDGWRCPQCIWNERENLIEWARNLLNAIDMSGKHCSLGMGVNDARLMIVVSRKSMDDLVDVIQEVTALPV